MDSKRCTPRGTGSTTVVVGEERSGIAGREEGQERRREGTGRRGHWPLLQALAYHSQGPRSEDSERKASGKHCSPSLSRLSLPLWDARELVFVVTVLLSGQQGLLQETAHQVTELSSPCQSQSWSPCTCTLGTRSNPAPCHPWVSLRPRLTDECCSSSVLKRAPRSHPATSVSSGFFVRLSSARVCTF